ncbi:MAG: HGxxPAAW family protein [Streptosporangiales bacterium]
MAEEGHTRGRPSSWVAVGIILAGFVLGGVALIVSQWWMFWVGVGIAVVGGIIALAGDIFSNVELDPIVPGEEHVSPVKGEVTATAPGGLKADKTSPGNPEGSEAAEGRASA